MVWRVILASSAALAQLISSQSPLLLADALQITSPVIGRESATYQSNNRHILFSSSSCNNNDNANHAPGSSCTSRRSWLQQDLPLTASLSLAAAMTAVGTLPYPSHAVSVAAATTFRTQAFDLKEYTNSITASKDTNVSPKEAYDVIKDTIQPIAKTISANKNNNANANRALDVGAGAGVSTQTLYDMGFTTMDAIDWSGTAWNENVVECPPSVQFFEMDDERFFSSLLAPSSSSSSSSSQSQQQQQQGNRKYHVIVYNFAINLDKAVRVAKAYLDPTLDDARLLVPANAQKDYWYKQSYYLIDAAGDIVWKSKPDVGAWSVQFQPDVTSETCQGPWCPPYNGFVKWR